MTEQEKDAALKELFATYKKQTIELERRSRVYMDLHNKYERLLDKVIEANGQSNLVRLIGEKEEAVKQAIIELKRYTRLKKKQP